MSSAQDKSKTNSIPLSEALIRHFRESITSYEYFFLAQTVLFIPETYNASWVKFLVSIYFYYAGLVLLEIPYKRSELKKVKFTDLILSYYLGPALSYIISVFIIMPSWDLPKFIFISILGIVIIVQLRPYLLFRLVHTLYRFLRLKWLQYYADYLEGKISKEKDVKK